MFMETHDLYSEICSWENLWNAYHKAAKGKWFRPEVAKFAMNLEENLISIQNELIYQTYKVGRYREFFVYEPKKRLVMALQFRDRIVQWAIYLQVNHIFDKSMIYHSYGCRVGKGTVRAADKLQDWCTLANRKPKDWYYLKLDISKYFYRVDHEVLLGILKRKFPHEEKFITLMKEIIECDHTPFGLPPGKSVDDVLPEERLYTVGMPIGNLTSQMLANVCLNELDQFIKHELRAHFYVRYMDDMVILHESPVQLNVWKRRIEHFLNHTLHLELNSKTAIGKVKTGITFVGCRVFPGYRKPTKKFIRKMKNRIKAVSKQYKAGIMTEEQANAVVQSYLGQIKHCSAMRLENWIKETVPFETDAKRRKANESGTHCTDS